MDRCILIFRFRERFKSPLGAKVVFMTEAMNGNLYLPSGILSCMSNHQNTLIKPPDIICIIMNVCKYTAKIQDMVRGQNIVQHTGTNFYLLSSEMWLCPLTLGTASLTHVLILSTLHQMSSQYSLASAPSISVLLYGQTYS